MENLELRPCHSDDLENLVTVSRKTFTDAFAAKNNPADFKAYIASAFNRKTLRKALNHPHSHFFFVLLEGILAGYIKLNEHEAQTDIGAPEALEIERFYVLETYQGRAIGQWLTEKVKGIALQKGKKYLWLGVWEENKSAIRFYERQGFYQFGKHPYYVGSDRQIDWLMRLDL